jgi:uncharacterized RDD family membrane protein YckC
MADDPRQAYPAEAYAGFWRRVLASIIDTIIVMIVFVLPAYLLFGREFISLFNVTQDNYAANLARMNEMLMWFYAAAIVFQILYKTLCESTRLQATPGKLAVGIVVTDLYGRRISFARSLARSWPAYGTSVSGIIAILVGAEELSDAFQLAAVISCIFVAVPPYKQGLHDRMARCLVLRQDAQLTPVSHVFD